MIDLPAGLAPWAAQLSLLPTDLALTLAPWVGRLAFAMGPLSESHKQNAGEPDGYSGLARRGSYERLVTAEWGIADLFPDEFLRRAAAGEHLFLELARSEPKGALRSVAIVSAGPAQLGAPRLAHLAALVVLARRAAAAGAGFSWGVFEDREHRLIDGLDDTAVQRFLAARTAVAVDHDAIISWLDALGGEADRDVWFVGDSNAAAVARRSGVACLVVRDLLEPQSRALEVEIERRGPSSRLRLELPTPELCARLLRDPYGRGGPPRVVPAAGPANEVRFAPGGRRLLVRLADGGVESWPIPTSLRDKVGNPRRWIPPRGHSVIALGIGKRSVLAATATRDDPTAIELSYSNNHRFRVMLPTQVSIALSARFAAGGTIPVGWCGLVLLRENAEADLIIDVLGHLLVIDRFWLWPKPGTVLTALPFNATASAPAPLAVATAFFSNSVVWAERHENAQIRIIEATASGNREVARLGARAEPEVLFGFALPQAAGWGVVAVAWDAEHRRVAVPGWKNINLRAVAPVVGVCLQNGVPALLTRPHPYRLAWIVGDTRELLPTSATPIVSVAVCPVQPNVAWVTETGEVVIYSMQHRAVLMRRLPGASQ